MTGWGEDAEIKPVLMDIRIQHDGWLEKRY